MPAEVEASCDDFAARTECSNAAHGEETPDPSTGTTLDIPSSFSIDLSTFLDVVPDSRVDFSAVSGV